MDIVAPFIPLLFLLSLYAAYIKVSARFFNGIIDWRNSYVFVVMVAGISLISRAVSAVTDISLPVSVSLVFGLLINAGLGAIYFGKHVTNRGGQAIDHLQGMKMGLVVFIFLAANFFLLLEAYVLFLLLSGTA